MARDEIQQPFDAFEISRALHLARQWFLHQWGGDSVNAALGAHFFQRAIADFRASPRAGRVKRSALTAMDFAEVFKTTDDSPGAEPRSTAKSDETFRTASHDLQKDKLSRFPFYFELDPGEWYRFTFSVADSHIPGVRRVGRYLSVSYDACPHADVPEHVNTTRPLTAVNEPPTLLPLPRYPSPEFLGRDDELRRIRRGIRSGTHSPLVAVNGAPGVGKTDLILAAASEFRYRFPEILYIQFPEPPATLDEPRLAARRSLVIAGALRRIEDAFAPDARGTVAFTEEAFRTRYLSLLQGRNVLVICDNAASGADVEIFRPPSGCAMIASSRAALAIRHAADEFELLPLSDFAGAELLVRLAPEHFSKRSEAEDAATAAPDDPSSRWILALALATRCEGLPIALEAVGMYLRLRPDVTATEVLAMLLDVGRMLELSAESSDTLPSPVASVFEMSFRGLSAQLQHALAMLAVFHSSFSPDAALAVISDVSLLNDLVRHRLVRFDAASRRYFMLDLLRAFAEGKLSIDNRESALLAFAQYFSTYATSLGSALEDHTPETFMDSVNDFRLEAANLDTTMHLLSHRVEYEDRWAGMALQFAPLLAHPSVAESFFYLGWTATVTHAASVLNDEATFRRALFSYGLAVSRTSADLSSDESESADSIFNRSRDLAKDAGDTELECSALDELIWCARRDGRYADALRYIAERIPLERSKLTLNLFLNLLLAADITVTEGLPQPASIPRLEIGPRQHAGTYAALVLYDTVNAFLGVRLMLQYQLRALPTPTRLSYDVYLAHLVVTGGYESLGPVQHLRNRLHGVSALLPQFPINCVPYLDGITQAQAIDWLELGSLAAVAVGRNLTAAHMKLLRANFAHSANDLGAAVADLREAIRLADGELANEDVVQKAKSLLKRVEKQRRTASSRRKPSKKPR